MQQLVPLDDMRTPTDVLRVITRTWDSLLGVLGVWSRHAQADDFMPLMAWIVIQAAPARLVSQLHFLHNHIGDLLLSRQEMWLAHFTAACEVACRLSLEISDKGLAISLPSSPCWPAPDDDEGSLGRGGGASASASAAAYGGGGAGTSTGTAAKVGGSTGTGAKTRPRPVALSTAPRARRGTAAPSR